MDSFGIVSIELHLESYFEETADCTLLLRPAKGKSWEIESSSNSSQISSDSVILCLWDRVTLSNASSLVLGLRGSPREERWWSRGCLRNGNPSPFARGVSSCASDIMESVSISDSQSSWANPMPGASGFWETGERVVGSSLRRHERASTPRRSTIVPSAI